MGYANLDGQCTCILIDNGARMNTVMPAYVQTHDLDMGRITELQSVNLGIVIHGVGGAHTGPMGYIVMKVQIEGVPSYGEDQVFLVVEPSTNKMHNGLLMLTSINNMCNMLLVVSRNVRYKKCSDVLDLTKFF